MIASRIVAFAAITLSSVVSASAVEEDWVLSLLKRQEPGTPAYACHSACGNSITLSRGADPCTDQSFLSQYADCLACAGPDNINIWRYYGATLTVAGTKCGLSTTPASGGSASSSSAVAPPSTTPTPTPTTTPPTSPTDTPSTTTPPSEQSTSVASSTPPTTTPAPQSSPSASAAASSSSATVSVTVSRSSSVAPAGTTTAPSGTLPAGNGTATNTSVQFTGGANSQRALGVGAIGAAVFALLV